MEVHSASVETKTWEEFTKYADERGYKYTSLLTRVVKKFLEKEKEKKTD